MMTVTGSLRTLRAKALCSIYAYTIIQFLQMYIFQPNTAIVSQFTTES